MTPNKHNISTDWPQSALDAYDKGMSGMALTQQESVIDRRLSTAAAFAAQAYEMGDKDGQGTHALCRAFLCALIDPLHPDLDYLRIDPASGPKARQARKGETT